MGKASHPDAHGSTRAPDAPDDPSAWVFRLYVAGMSPHSAQAIRTIKTICEEHLPGAHELSVFDLYQDPGLASESGVLATPTLDKIRPSPALRLVGSMSDVDHVVRALGIAVEGTR